MSPGHQGYESMTSGIGVHDTRDMSLGYQGYEPMIPGT